MRTGQFTSSSIYKLMTTARDGKSFGKPALTYIQEKRYELKLGRQLNAESFSYPTSWGNLCEQLAFDRLSMDWVLESKTRIQNPSIPEHSGAIDCVMPDKVGDIKCPYTLKSFCQMVESFEQGVEAFKKVKPEYYWQLVSNAILAGVDQAAIALFVPYKDDLQEIREAAMQDESYSWIYYRDDEALPYLMRGEEYNTIEGFEFVVPPKDKELLTGRIEEAIKLLKA